MSKMKGIDFNVAIQVPHLEFPNKWISLNARYDENGTYLINFTVKGDEKTYEITGHEWITHYNWEVSADTTKETYRLSVQEKAS